MSKGNQTRDRILGHAMRMASVSGLDQLSIGGLAQDLKMSKSGLFAHFGSREVLQVAVIEATIRCFEAEVVQPALALPPGQGQLRALVQNWIGWSYGEDRPGGCSLAAAAFEFDGQAGRVRDRVAAAFKLWRRTLLRAVERGKEVDIPAGVDGEELVGEIFGLYFSQHLFHWLLGEAGAGEAALMRYDRIVASWH